MRRPILHIVAVLAIYWLLMQFIFLPEAYYPIRDNLMFHAYTFSYYANSLLHGFGLPLWYVHSGGVPAGLLTLPWHPTMPYRFIGYGLYSMLSLDMISAYKITLLIGMSLMLTGWWLLVKKLFSSDWAATVGTLLILFGGTGLTVLHHEHMLANIFWTPWYLLALSHIQKDFRFLVVAAIFGALSMSNYYPHYFLIGNLFIVVIMLSARRLNWLLQRSFWQRRNVSILTLAAVSFLLTASPMFYIAKEKNAYSSPIRIIHGRGLDEGTGAHSIKEYIRLNSTQPASAFLYYFKQYILPETQVPDDVYAFSITRTGLVLALIAALMYYQVTWHFTLLALAMFWATLGIHGYLPLILFILHFPYVGFFRQWYHFVPYLNFALALLASAGVALLNQRIQATKKQARLIASLGCALIIAALTWEGSVYYNNYYDTHLRPHKDSFTKALRFSSQNQFINFLNTDWIDWLKQRQLKDQWSGWVGKTLSLFEAKERFAASQLHPEQMLSPYRMPEHYIDIEIDIEHQEPAPLVLTPRGFSFSARLNQPASLVIPLSPAMLKQMRITINGQATPASPTDDHVNIRIHAPAGESEIRGELFCSEFEWLLGLQYLMLGLAIGLSLTYMRLARKASFN